MPAIYTSHTWNELIRDTDALQKLCAESLKPYVYKVRWFAGKSNDRFTLELEQVVPIHYTDNEEACLLLFRSMDEGKRSDTYALFMAACTENTIPYITIDDRGLIDTFKCKDLSGTLIDALYDERFRHFLYDTMQNNSSVNSNGITLRGCSYQLKDAYNHSQILPLNQSNTSLTFNDTFFFKQYRRLQPGGNPEIDMLQTLTECGFAYIPAYRGSLYIDVAGEAFTLGLMQNKLSFSHDAWTTACLDVREYAFDNTNGNTLFFAELGNSTAAMHKALYNTRDKAFATETFNTAYDNLIEEHIEHSLKKILNCIKEVTFNDEAAEELRQYFMQHYPLIETYYKKILATTPNHTRIRIHGDYHLGQVLHTAEGLITMDFEGEPDRTFTQRKIKHSPLKDVAGMVRSLHYAYATILYESPLATDAVRQRMKDWYNLAAQNYFNAYVTSMQAEQLLNDDTATLHLWLTFYTLEKCLYEISYELNSRPDWAKIPLLGFEFIIERIKPYIA